MRAADVMEKVTRKNPAFLRLYRSDLLSLMKETQEQELRWYLAVMVPRLMLSAKERQLAMSLLSSYLEDRSSIVKSFALQGLADLAQGDRAVRDSTDPLVPVELWRRRLLLKV